MILTNYFIKREIQKLMRKASDRPHQYRSLNDIKNVLIICDSKDWNIMRACIEKLRSMNKTVNTTIFAISQKDVPTWYSNYLLIRADKDINIWGFPDKALQRQFYHLPADLLIDFSSIHAYSLHYMFLKHPSTFKAGVKHSEDVIYDFSIIPPEDSNDLKFLFDQLINYLNTIQSKTVNG